MLTSGSCLASPPLFFRVLSERTAPVRISCSCLSISRSNSSLCLSLDTLSNKVHAPSTRCPNSSSTKLLWLLFVTEPPDWPERWSKFSTALVKTLFLSLLTPGKNYFFSTLHYLQSSSFKIYPWRCYLTWLVPTDNFCPFLNHKIKHFENCRNDILKSRFKQQQYQLWHQLCWIVSTITNERA